MVVATNAGRVSSRESISCFREHMPERESPRGQDDRCCRGPCRASMSPRLEEERDIRAYIRKWRSGNWGRRFVVAA